MVFKSVHNWVIVSDGSRIVGDNELYTVRQQVMTSFVVVVVVVVQPVHTPLLLHDINCGNKNNVDVIVIVKQGIYVLLRSQWVSQPIVMSSVQLHEYSVTSFCAVCSKASKAALSLVIKSNWIIVIATLQHWSLAIYVFLVI